MSSYWKGDDMLLLRYIALTISAISHLTNLCLTSFYVPFLPSML